MRILTLLELENPIWLTKFFSDKSLIFNRTFRDKRNILKKNVLYLPDTLTLYMR